MVLLVEPEVRNIIQNKLQECHQVRLGFYSRIFFGLCRFNRSDRYLFFFFLKKSTKASTLRSAPMILTIT
jgi:hypothetical protein